MSKKEETFTKECKSLDISPVDIIETENFHGSEVRILGSKISGGEIFVYGLVLDEYDDEWSYMSWNKKGENSAGCASMCDIKKHVAEQAIEKF